MFFNSMAIAAPDWLRDGRIGGTSISSSMNQSELIALIDQRASENVSVLELDSRLSEYLTDAEFDVEVAFIDRAAELAHERGLKAVIYYPGLEVLTQNGVNLASTMYKDHPEWIQKGIGGAPNVFYGNQEVWVDPNAESAWLSPNTGYLDYFLERIAKLAATDVDGVWVDVPIYLETGAGWAGAEPEAAADFTAWTIAEGLNPPNGYTVPSSADFNSPAFRSWV
ncbi:hypothetical protein AB833_10730 [Chromatiales bacterium (ex Bugula neritina AB1)]|nr:hypothetical protein AB833_10730 [Chromatiales bacterium (ex Bugula neritina AB1)]